MHQSNKDQKTQTTSSTKRQETQTPSTKTKKACMCQSTKDQETQPTPSTKIKDQLVQLIQAVIPTEDQQTSITPPATFTRDTESKKFSATPMSSNAVHGTSTISSSAVVKKQKGNRLKLLIFHGILGEGAFGKVVLASYATSKGKVAVKIIQKKKLLERDPSTAIIEHHILKQFKNHPYITHLYGAIQTEVSLYLPTFLSYSYTALPYCSRPSKIDSNYNFIGSQNIKKVKPPSSPMAVFGPFSK